MMYPSFNARAVGLTLPADEAIDLAAGAGFEGVDLLVRDLIADGHRPARLRARMDALGLRGGAFPLPVDWRGDADTFRRDLATLPALADAAAELGLVRTGTWVLPECVDAPGRDPQAETLRFHIDRLAPIADVLAARSIRLGLEVIGPERSRAGRFPRFITRLGELGPILDALSGRTNVGILIDAFHLYAAEESLAVALQTGVGSIAWVHVADLPTGASGDRAAIVDADRGLPGDHGAVDNRGLLAAITAGGYDGPVTAEPLERCASLAGLTPVEIASTVFRSLRSVWPVAAGGA